MLPGSHELTSYALNVAFAMSDMVEFMLDSRTYHVAYVLTVARDSVHLYLLAWNRRLCRIREAVRLSGRLLFWSQGTSCGVHSRPPMFRVGPELVRQIAAGSSPLFSEVELWDGISEGCCTGTRQVIRPNRFLF